MKESTAIERAIERWLDEGLIDAATARRLAAREAAQQSAGAGRLAILAFGFGGVLLAAGVFLFVAANWQDLSPWTRFGIVLAMVALLHAGAAAGGRYSRPLGTSLHAVGTAAFGAGIFLSGQMFNLQENWPEAFGLWALGAGFAALLLRDWPQILWAAVLGPAWLLTEWLSRFPVYRALSGEALESVVPFGIVVLSVAYLAAPGRLLDSPWRHALARLGAVALLVSASELASTGSEAFFPAAELEPVPATWLLLGWSVAIGLPLLLAGLMRRREAWPVVIAAALAGIVIALDPATTWQRLCIYLVYAAGSAGLVWWGFRDRQTLRVNLGVLCFVLTVLAFYFSSLFDMLGRSAGLIGLGLLCIGGGWIADRGRRRLLLRLREVAP